jgi:small-conductance mechanosensitive channel
MQCRNCGTEIAAKALICYRCGTATTEAAFKPAARPRRSAVSLITSVLALGLLVIVALYAGRVPTGQTPRLLSEIAVAIAVLVVVLRAYARRR